MMSNSITMVRFEGGIFDVNDIHNFFKISLSSLYPRVWTMRQFEVRNT